MINPGRQSTEVLIVGSGLAGTLLARALDESGVDWRMLTDPGHPGASRAAGALVNPLTGRRFTQPPFLDWLWQGVDWAFGDHPAWQPQPILRLYRFADQVEAVERRRADPDYQPYLGEEVAAGSPVAGLASPHGGIWVRGGGVLDVQAYLDHYHRTWRSQGRLVPQHLKPADLGVRKDRVVGPEGLSAARVIFCEGAAVVDNPWFGSLPITPIKGEVLLIRSRGLDLDHPLIGRKWLIPRGEGCHVLGATHERGSTDPRPTAAGRKALLEGLQTMRADRNISDVEVLEHRCGIRPGRSANRAIIGFHPDRARLGVFNGLGSKGCLLGPAHARLLARHIAEDISIPVELNASHLL